MRHLESQRSLLALGKDSPGLSVLAKKMRLAPDHHVAVIGASAIKAVKADGLLWVAYPKGGTTRGATDLPATPWWTKRDVLGEITGVTGYKPVAFVKIDDNWTALRFKKT